MKFAGPPGARAASTGSSWSTSRTAMRCGSMADPAETVRGTRVTIRFEAKRCIHSRHCVLDRPDVFVPNVAGEWIHPDAATADEIAELAHNCPSGAISYERQDGGVGEQAPLVNVVRVR